MLSSGSALSPTIAFRPIRLDDLDILEQIHLALFPIRYEREFFFNVVTGNGITSWGAVDTSRTDGRSDELIGFVTTRIFAAKDSELEDLFRYRTSSERDICLVYILTLGVVESYRNLGVASLLVREVINYARSISSCRAVYLHVIEYNHAAINFYRKMSFKLVRRLRMFYYIGGHHYDSYLFAFFVNGGLLPCSPLKMASSALEYLRGFWKTLLLKVRRNGEDSTARWSRCKETSTLLVSQSIRILGVDDAVSADHV